MNLKKQTLLAASCLALLLGAGPSEAGLVLKLNDGAGHSITINDGGVGDLDSHTGSVAWFGSLGNWIFNFTAGLSTLNPASLELTSLNATSKRGGNLTITLIDDSYTGLAGTNYTATTSIGGITSGSVTFGSRFNSTSIGSLSSTGPSFSGTTSSNVVLDTTGGFSLTQVATIHHTGSGVTGFSVITTVPEPATLGLLGLGLVGLAFVRRRQGAK